MMNLYALMGMLGPIGDIIIILFFAAVVVGLLLWWRHLDKKRTKK
jgi:hypothetical protein